jgi:hypothetical protein
MTASQASIREKESRSSNAKVHLSSPEHEYYAVTDSEGSFSIWPVPAGKYSFAVRGWGEHQLEVKSWDRGKINRPGLVFSRHKNASC